MHKLCLQRSLRFTVSNQQQPRDFCLYIQPSPRLVAPFLFFSVRVPFAHMHTLHQTIFEHFSSPASLSVARDCRRKRKDLVEKKNACMSKF